MFVKRINAPGESYVLKERAKEDTCNSSTQKDGCCDCHTPLSGRIKGYHNRFLVSKRPNPKTRKPLPNKTSPGISGAPGGEATPRPRLDSRLAVELPTPD